jgi:hypothetical protein
MNQLHIIFTEEQVIVSRKAYASWQEIQGDFDSYKASLGPWDELTTVAWLEEEYDLLPSADEQVRSLLSSDQTIRALSFLIK